MANAADPDHYRLLVSVANVRGERAKILVELWDVLEALGLEQNAYRMCAFKYLWRAGRKTLDPLTDLKKAATYLAREIARLEDHRKRFPDVGAPFDEPLSRDGAIDKRGDADKGHSAR